jgi:RNA polymerase sigma factor (sigma-70 family)
MNSPRADVDFESLRSRLFGVAYRVLGRADDAEDIVQDVWIRWHGTDRTQVRDRVGFLVTATTRAALNAATSSRARREVSAGAALPGRDVTAADPALRVERAEALTFAVHLLIERLSPVERAVYVLREAFEYPFREIAEILHVSETNARQLGRRARTRLAGQRKRPVDPAERARLVDAFVHAARAGHLAGLVDRLTV